MLCQSFKLVGVVELVLRTEMIVRSSVTRLGDLLDFSLWQQLICPNRLHSWAIFVKMSKSIIFLVKSCLGNFYRHLTIFFLVTLVQSHRW